MPPVSAYVPCFNNEATILAAVESIRLQIAPVAEIFVVDDGSTDQSVARLESAGVEVVRLGRNCGRGTVRAAAMERAANDLVLCCDATNFLPPDFLSRALPWFDAPDVAAAFGRITQPAAGNAVHRWRGRHLFKVNESLPVHEHAVLGTYGAVVRRSMALAVGNFDRRLRHTEDHEIGQRLLARGFKVVFDPALAVESRIRNTLSQVMERYWRWYAGTDERVSLAGYLRQVWYSVKVMAVKDAHAGDWGSVPLSLLSPHYQFWKSLSRRLVGRRQSPLDSGARGRS